jgi:hypothetical protein
MTSIKDCISGRKVTDQEKRFNLLKSETEEAEIICENCSSPDSIEHTITEEVANGPPVVNGNTVGSSNIFFGPVDIVQPYRLVTRKKITCLFCQQETTYVDIGPTQQRVVERRDFSVYATNATASTMNLDITSTSTGDNLYFSIYDVPKGRT